MYVWSKEWPKVPGLYWFYVTDPRATKVPPVVVSISSGELQFSDGTRHDKEIISETAVFKRVDMEPPPKIEYTLEELYSRKWFHCHGHPSHGGVVFFEKAGDAVFVQASWSGPGKFLSVCQVRGHRSKLQIFKDLYLKEDPDWECLDACDVVEFTHTDD